MATDMHTTEEDVYEEYTDDEATDTEEHSGPNPALTITAPKRVKPAAVVASMEHHSPANPPQLHKNTGKLNPMKNPFPTNGDWTPETFAEVAIIVPALTATCESTNELTRATRPEARYWKAPVKFSYSTFSSDTLRISNVHVPYHTGRGYGGSYVYVCLPAFMMEKFATAGKVKRPTVVNETSLVPDSNRWWKIANNVGEKFGVIDKATNKFHAKSLEVIFSSTGKGISCSVVGRFVIKASTNEKEPLRPTTTQRVVFEVDRAYIADLDVDVQPPVRAQKSDVKIAPKAIATDVATDDLMKRLANLGI